MLEIMFPCASETRAGDTTASSINKYAHFLEKKKKRKRNCIANERRNALKLKSTRMPVFPC